MEHGVRVWSDRVRVRGERVRVWGERAWITHQEVRLLADGRRVRILVKMDEEAGERTRGHLAQLHRSLQ